MRFVREVLCDPNRPKKIGEESLEDYAERRKINLLNPRCSMASKQKLEERIRELETENEELHGRLDEIADIVAPEEEESEDGESGEE